MQHLPELDAMIQGIGTRQPAAAGFLRFVCLFLPTPHLVLVDSEHICTYLTCHIRSVGNPLPLTCSPFPFVCTSECKGSPS